MRKKMHDKISAFFKELSQVRLASWMSGLGLFLFLPFVNLQIEFMWEDHNGYSFLFKILSTLLLVILIILYIAAAIGLNARDKDEAERYRSIEDYRIYRKFTGYRLGSYNEYIVAASNKYVESIFENNMNLGISCAIMDFMTDNDNINSLYSIDLFSYYIRQHWDKYENREVVIDCFLLPFNGLSMTPFAKDGKFQCNYDKEFLDYLKRKKPVHCTKNKDAFDCIVGKFKYSYRNDEFNIGFRCPEGFDYWRYANEKDLPIFVKVRGNLTLDQYSNSFVIGNCRFEDQYYERYIATIKEKSN